MGTGRGERKWRRDEGGERGPVGDFLTTEGTETRSGEWILVSGEWRVMIGKDDNNGKTNEDRMVRRDV